MTMLISGWLFITVSGVYYEVEIQECHNISYINTGYSCNLLH